MLFGMGTRKKRLDRNAAHSGIASRNVQHSMLLIDAGQQVL